MSISFKDISHRYNESEVLHQVSLEVMPGEILSVLGPSGSGKSTLLRLAAGLEQVQTGELRINDDIVGSSTHHLAPEARDSVLMFQDHALFPHLTVAENIAFGLHQSTAEKKRRTVDDQLDRVGMAGFEDRYPGTLSGGQQQRVALARALAVEPAVLLLDEPFANVDIALRRSLREDARLTLKAAGVTTMLVTHDPEEAMFMADRLACLVDGNVVQAGTPEELWATPAHPFVAQSVRDAQVIEATWDGSRLRCAFGNIGSDVEGEAGGRLVCIHPDAVNLTTTEDSQVEVLDVRFVQGRFSVRLGADDQQLNISLSEQPGVSSGDRVQLHFTTSQISVYSA